MSEQDIQDTVTEVEETEATVDVVEASEDNENEEQLDEFKASMGDPSEVPEPVNKKAKKLKGSKDGGEKTAVTTPGSTPPKTKVAAINAMMTKLHSMKKEDLLAMHDAFMSEEVVEQEEATDETVDIRDVAAITADDIDVSDDVKAMFGDEDLSEDFKEKAATIFSAAIVSKINEQLAKISTETDAEIEAAKAAYDQEMTEKVDSYLDYVVEEWTKDNQIAIDRGLKSELTEDFLRGLHDLFAEHYVDVPEEKVDVVEELAAKVEELEDNLNKEIEKNVELKKVVAESSKDDILRKVSDGLADTEVEKLRQLAAGIEFEAPEDYENKLSIVKEQYFNGEETEELTSPIEADDEAVDLDEETTEQPQGSMAVYLNTISRSVKK